MRSQWFIAWGVVLWLAFLPSTSWAETQADQLCAQGNALYKAGKIKKAHAAYQGALDVNLDHRGAMSGYAKTSYKLGDYQEAERTFRDLVVLYPDDRDAQFYVAKVDLRRGRIEDAKRRLLLFLDKHPNDVPILAVLGQAEYLWGNCYAGTDFLNRAARQRPNDEKLQKAINRYRDRGTRICDVMRVKRETAEWNAAYLSWLERFDEVYERLKVEEADEDEEILRAARKEIILSNIRRREALFDASLPRQHWHDGSVEHYGQIDHETHVTHSGAVDLNVRPPLRPRRRW